MENIIVTGGFGFIGLNLLSFLTRKKKYFVHNIDNLSLGNTYVDNFLTKEQKKLIQNHNWDINEKSKVTQILEKYWETLSCHPRGTVGTDGARIDFDDLTQMAETLSKSNGKQDKFAFASETTLRLLFDTALSELSPVCAVLGGLIGQEITKAIAGKGQPICNSNGSNWLFFDPMGMIDKKGGAIVKSNPPKA